jgi:hypothetical protein
MSKAWTQAEAIRLCCAIERIAPEFGCHVALTGGCLYKDGERKDLDVLFYRIRQRSEINTEGLFAALADIGLVKAKGFGWCFKADYNGKAVDMFFPEEVEGEYASGEEAKQQVAIACLGSGSVAA